MTKTRVAWIAAVLCCLAGPAYTAGGPAAEVLARAKAGQGGSAWDAVRTIHATATVETSGLSGSLDAWDDVATGRYRDAYDLGAVRGASGFDGTISWSQDDSGHAHEEEGPRERQAAVNEAYRRARAYWYPSRRPGEVRYAGRRSDERGEFDVLTVTPEGSKGFELWIDTRTGLTDRTVERLEPQVVTSYFSDYRPAGGLMLPHAIHVTNGETRYDQRIAVTRYEIDAQVAAKAFAMPPPPPRDFGIAGGGTSTVVPFELVNNHIYADVRIDGRGPFRLLVDTGGMNIVTPELARELGLQSEGALQGRGVGEKSEDVAVTRVRRLELGGAYLDDQVFYVFPLESMSAVEGIPVRGLVGYEVFKRFVVRLDYERREITLTEPAGWQYRGDGVVLPFVYDDNTPQVEGAIDGIPGRFDLDTGSRASVDLMVPFAREHGLAAKYASLPERIVGYGVGGPARGRVVPGRRLELGPVVIDGVYAALSSATQGSFAQEGVAGNVGGEVLRRFSVTFDYGRKQLVLERNAHFAEPATYDRSGLWLHLGQGAWNVVEVVPGTPAAAAGMRAGDRLLSVDGRTPAQMTLNELRQRLRAAPAGARIACDVESGGGRREALLIFP